MSYSAAAEEFAVATYLFTDPSWAPANGQIDRHVLNSTISFSWMPNGAIQTLSASTAQPGSDVTGFLYTPDLAPGDPCINQSAPYVPSNVTRQGSLPNTDYVLIALAPWLSARCTRNYLQAAQQDPVRGFLFFLPDGSASTPPDPSDPVWDLGDGGAWKNLNRYPVFAIPGATGALFLKESALYSGNITSVPNGQQLAQAYNPTDYVRLFVDVGIASTTQLPSLWVFLLIVVGILIGIIITASGLMHWLQLRRRRSLRRRVAAGEVDLEALGIQRLTVPQEVLDRMPLFEYGSGKPLADESTNVEKHVGQVHVVPDDAEKEENATGGRTAFANYQHQTTCAICLDDFTSTAGTADQPSCAVRQLPCNHIFHPECVDTFLRENSSLCPLCKSSALPTGYCPRVISNVMVRRERIIRRMRARIDGDDTNQSTSGRTFGRLPIWHRRSPSREALSNSLELQQPNSSEARSPTNVPAVPLTNPPVDTPRRREWARQRALAMTGRLSTPPLDQNQSRWKKVLGGVFPGIA